MIIYDEVQFLMKDIITQSAAGNYNSTITDGTTMTESNLSYYYRYSSHPTVVVGETPSFNGTPTLGTTGTNLNAIIADINDAAITGLVASKNATNNLVLTQHSFISGHILLMRTANNNLGLTANTYTPILKVMYIGIRGWVQVQIEAIRPQMDYIIKYFRDLGYRIERSTNPSNSNIPGI